MISDKHDKDFESKKTDANPDEEAINADDIDE